MQGEISGVELQEGGGQALKERLIDREPQELVALGGEIGCPLVGHKLEECLQAMTVNLEQVPDKTTPRLIQFHTFKNAANPPFLGGFSIFSIVAA